MKEKLYFNNLNGLRFFAALMVVICHIELNKKYFLLTNYREQLRYLGDVGVDLFFVLSGFLITILLLKEKEIYSFISFKKFYLRRILKIWPLYYFIIILSLFILPNFSLFYINGAYFDYDSKELIKVIVMFILMLPNLLYLIIPIPFAAQAWSIGTEEQFYIIWPIIVNQFNKYKTIFLSCIIIYWIFYGCLHLSFLNNLPYIELLKNYYRLLKFDLLSVGAFGAVLFYEKDKRLYFFYNSFVFIASIIAIVLLYIYMPNLYEFFRLFYAILFIIIILNLVGNKKLENIFENQLLNYLGKISYGIYMYHQIIIVFFINILLKYFNKFEQLNNILIYSSSIILTVIVSHLSYAFFEKPILRYKSRFSLFINEKQ